MLRFLARVVAVVVVLFAVACSRAAPKILLFDGSGTSANDVAALERVLGADGLAYAKAGSRRLNDMSRAELGAFSLLIVPGGNFEEMGNGLTPATAAKVRDAVRGGVNYLGICAGAFLAGRSPYNGLDLTDGVRFGFYAIEDRGVRKAAVPVVLASGASLDQYWEDGPELTGWGDAVARYADGTPAVAQGAVGQGWVILSGTHPEAPASWRRGMTFSTPVEDDQAYAAVLVRAALGGTRLAHF